MTRFWRGFVSGLCLHPEGAYQMAVKMSNWLSNEAKL